MQPDKTFMQQILTTTYYGKSTWVYIFRPSLNVTFDSHDLQYNKTNFVRAVDLQWDTVGGQSTLYLL